MKFGVREICDVVFKAKADIKIGSRVFKKGEPVLFIDTAKTSTIEGAATTVYATGGRGNTRLIAWEGEKTLTFTVEDALLSPIGFAVLSGAGLFKGQDAEKVHVHMTATAQCGATDGVIDLSDALATGEKIDDKAPVYVIVTEEDGSLGDLVGDCEIDKEKGQTITVKEATAKGKAVFVDFYVVKDAAKVSELQIDMAHFGGYYYVEASTLFRRQSDGVDLPAEITFPNVKIQSNFTFSMASTGDPSTFTFTMDAFPGYTLFDKSRKVLCVIQVVEDASAATETVKSVMSHDDNEVIEEATKRAKGADEKFGTADDTGFDSADLAAGE